MSTKLKAIYNKQEWDACIKECGFFDFYHTFDYHHLSKAEDETPLLLKYSGKYMTVAIPLLARKIKDTNYKDATSVYGYAGPIYKGNIANFDNKKFKNALTKYFLDNNFVSIFSRLSPFINAQNVILKDIGIIVRLGKVVNIDIQKDLDKQRHLFQSRLKTHINRARRLCQVKIATTCEDLEQFKSIYYENMDRVNAKEFYYFNDSYFEKIIKSNDFKSEILLAIDNETGKTIAGCLFITTNGIVQYHLSGTKNDYLHLTPTKLLIDEMRIMASQRGHTFFNLGGGLGGRNDDSLFNFKASFSKDFKEFNLWKFIVNQEVYDELVIKKGIVDKSNYFPLYRLLNDF